MISTGVSMSRTYVMGDIRTSSSGFTRASTPVSFRMSPPMSDDQSAETWLLIARSEHAAANRFV
jgi:hypothetical protein